VTAALDAVADGSARALAVVGEPGIGKTRLLAELGALAEHRGQLVLSGRAAEFERDLPFGVFVDALDDHLRALDPQKVQRLGVELGGELAQVFPALSGLAVSSVPVLQDERYRAHRAVRELLERLAAGRPLVLVLDDLHWADHSSIELLSALLRRPPNAAVLVAVSLRPHHADAGLASVLEHAYREGPLEHLELCALSRGEADQLLAPSLPPSLRATVYAQAGGNPFYLEELARSLERAAPAAGRNREQAAIENIAVPLAVSAALAQELGLLCVTTRRLLEGAAVAGDPFEPELAGAAAELTEDAARAALDELLECDLVRPTELPRRFRFRHPLVRRAVYEAMPGGWRLGAHERAAKALAARGAQPSARAHHVEQSGRVGDLNVIALLSQAGAAAAQRAPASAARWFEAALRLLPDERVGSEQRIELLIALATSLAAAGRLRDSRSSLRLLLELVPDEAAAVRVKVIVRCATIENLLGCHSHARDRLRSALDELSDRSLPEAIALMIEVAIDGFYSADYGRMRDWAKQALDGARPLGERPLVAATTAIVAFACACAGDVAEGQRHTDEAARLVNALSDSELARRLDASPALAWAEYSLERYEDSIGHSERGIAAARATGRGEYMQEMLRAHAASSMRIGRIAEAIDSAERAVEAARLAGNRQSLIRALTYQAGAMIDRDAKSALHAVEESVVLTREVEHNEFFAVARAMLATVLGEFGEAARCADELLEAGGGPELGLIPATWRVFYCEVLTRAELARGRFHEADQAARHAQSLADSLGLHLTTSWAQRARAEVLLAEHNPIDAAQLALASAAQAATVGARVEAARSQALAGRALRSTGERDRAVVELQAAAAEFESCDAIRLCNGVERELRRLGRRFKRRREHGDAGVGALSVRELEIAELVTARKTNREIAAELFLSEKTIETHLRKHLWQNRRLLPPSGRPRTRDDAQTHG
jgi:DNA-binding CsgD family transcriptional regulator